MKTVIKLIIAALIVHATWKTGLVFWRHYKFKDGAQNAALFAGTRSEAEIHGRVMEIAHELDLPIAPEELKVRKEPNHTYVNTAYTEKIEVVPTYFYPYEFKVDIDVFTLNDAGK